MQFLNPGHLNMPQLALSRRPPLDNHAQRPASVPADYVAYPTGLTPFERDKEYYGDILSYSKIYQDYERLPGGDSSFGPLTISNDLIRIGPN
jgi:hypothetical protein